MFSAAASIPKARAVAFAETSAFTVADPSSSLPETPKAMLPARAIEVALTFRVPSFRIVSLPSPLRIPAAKAFASAETVASAPAPTPTAMEPAVEKAKAFTVIVPELVIESSPLQPRIPPAKDSAWDPPMTGRNLRMKGRVKPSMLMNRVSDVMVEFAFEERVPLLRR